MPEELKPLSCPACGHHAEVYEQKELKNRSYVSCADTECSVCGPFADGINEAIKKWNALPRKLQWTEKQPTTTGFYMHKYNDDDSPRVRAVLKGDNQLITLALHGFEIIPVEKIYGKWAGPIPMPEEM